MIKNIKIYNKKTGNILIEKEFGRVNIMHSSELAVNNTEDTNNSGKSLILHSFSFLFASDSVKNNTFIIRKSNSIVLNSKISTKKPYINEDYVIQITSENGDTLSRGISKDKNDKLIAGSQYLNGIEIKDKKSFNEIIPKFFSKWPMQSGFQRYNKSERTFSALDDGYVPYTDYGNFWFKLQESGSDTEISGKPFKFSTSSKYNAKPNINSISILCSLIEIHKFWERNSIENIKRMNLELKDKKSLKKEFKTLTKKSRNSDAIPNEFKNELKILSKEVDDISDELKRVVLENPRSFLNKNSSKENVDQDFASEAEFTNLNNLLMKKINQLNKKLKELKAKNSSDSFVKLIADLYSESYDSDVSNDSKKIDKIYENLDKDIEVAKEISKPYFDKIENFVNDGNETDIEIHEFLQFLHKQSEKKINTPLLVFDNFAPGTNGKTNIEELSEMIKKTLFSYDFEQVFFTTSSKEQVEIFAEKIKDFNPLCIEMNILKF